MIGGNQQKPLPYEPTYKHVVAADRFEAAASSVEVTLLSAGVAPATVRPFIAMIRATGEKELNLLFNPPTK